MRTFIIIIITGSLVVSCTSRKAGSEIKTAGGKTAKEAVSFTEKYLLGQLEDAKLSVIANGLISVTGNDVKSFAIDPSKVVTGHIDNDSRSDAIVPVYILRGQSLTGHEHLVLLRSSGTFVIAVIMNNVFSIHGIDDGVVTAEISSITPDSPGYGCAECRDTVRYKFSDGQMVVID